MIIIFRKEYSYPLILAGARLNGVSKESVGKELLFKLIER